MRVDPTVQQSIRGMATLLAVHVAMLELMVDTFGTDEGSKSDQSVRDLIGVTLAALDDAGRYLGRAEVNRMLREARAGARKAAQP